MNRCQNPFESQFKIQVLTACDTHVTRMSIVACDVDVDVRKVHFDPFC